MPGQGVAAGGSPVAGEQHHSSCAPTKSSSSASKKQILVRLSHVLAFCYPEGEIERENEKKEFHKRHGKSFNGGFYESRIPEDSPLGRLDCIALYGPLEPDGFLYQKVLLPGGGCESLKADLASKPSKKRSRRASGGNAAGIAGAGQAPVETTTGTETTGGVAKKKKKSIDIFAFDPLREVDSLPSSSDENLSKEGSKTSKASKSGGHSPTNSNSSPTSSPKGEATKKGKSITACSPYIMINRDIIEIREREREGRMERESTEQQPKKERKFSTPF